MSAIPILDNTKPISVEEFKRVLKFSAPKPHASGAKVVNVLHTDNKQSIMMSLPLMLHWGAQEGIELATGKTTGKWSKASQFPSAEYETKETNTCLQNLKNFVTVVKEEAFSNSLLWFGKEIKNMEVIEDKMTPMLKYPKKFKGSQEVDESRPPTFPSKIPRWENTWKTEIYDEDRKPLYVCGKVNDHLSPLEFLPSKGHSIDLIQCGGIWFSNGKLSIVWNLKQSVVQKPKPTIEEGQCFLSCSNTDIERMKSLPPPVPQVDSAVDSSAGPVDSVIVEDSDDEGEEPVKAVSSVPVPPEVAPVPEVVPVASVPEVAPVAEVEPVSVEDVKPKKKIVRKKLGSD
jgi:hypothetical protein